MAAIAEDSSVAITASISFELKTGAKILSYFL
jgi:hypothetical protein